MTMHLEAMLDELVFSEANVAVPSGLSARVLERVWAEGMDRGAAATPVGVLRFDTVQRVRAGRSLQSTSFAVLAHLAALLLIGVLVRSGVKLAAPSQTQTQTQTQAIVELPTAPPQMTAKAQTMGGGGGQKGVAPVTKGTPPKFAEMQIVPPKAPALQQPKIVAEPTIEVQTDVKMANSLPQIGVANSPVLGMSMGNGSGSGLGSGDGSGLGAGSGGNTGGGPKRVGGGVSAPQVVFQVEPEFSEEARRTKVMGNVLVNLWVDAQGNPSHVRVVRGVGMGLDEKAVAAVKQYRFKPAMEGGKPVTVELNIEVNFQIF